MIFPSCERQEEVFKNMCDNSALQNRLKQCISDIFTTKKSAARDMLFKLLVYCTPLSWDSEVGVITVVGGEQDSCCVKTLVAKCYREA